MNCSTPGFPVHHQLPKLAQTHVHWVSDAIQPSHPLSSPFPPVLNLSQHQDLSQGVSSLHQVAKVLEFQLQHQSSNEYSGLISFRISLQSKRLSRVFSNTTVQKHQFFSTQLSLWSNSHIHMTTRKTTALTIQTFVSKVMSLLFNKLSRCVIASLPRSKCLLISWLRSPSAVILEPAKMRSVLFPLFPHLFAMKWWDRMPWS